jgi:hypothetical protein
MGRVSPFERDALQGPLVVAFSDGKPVSTRIKCGAGIFRKMLLVNLACDG